MGCLLSLVAGAMGRVCRRKRGKYPILGKEEVGNLKEKLTEPAVISVERARLAW